jgi:hypothetical protein
MEVCGQLNAPAALPLGKSLQYPLDRRVGPRVRMDAVEQRKISYPTRNQIPAIQPLAHYYID